MEFFLVSEKKKNVWNFFIGLIKESMEFLYLEKKI